MKKSYLFVLVSLMIVMSVVLGACAPAATPEPAAEAPAEAPVVATEVPATEVPAPVAIRYWHTMSDAEAAKLDEVIAAFEAANPGITVEATRYAYGDFKTAILTAIAGGDVPDTARMDIAWVSEFASQGALMQLPLSSPALSPQTNGMATTMDSPRTPTPRYWFITKLPSKPLASPQPPPPWKNSLPSPAPLLILPRVPTASPKVVLTSGHPLLSSMLWAARLPILRSPPLPAT